MSIRTILDRLDDDSGSLALTFSKLELQHDRGIPSRLEEVDFVEDLYQAVCRKELGPWKVRVVLAFTMAAILLIGSGLSPYLWESKAWLTHAIRIFAGLGVASAMAAYLILDKRMTELDIAFDAIRAEMEEGASVVDLVASRGADLS